MSNKYPIMKLISLWSFILWLWFQYLFATYFLSFYTWFNSIFLHNTNQFWRNAAFIQYQTKILATRWSCQIQSISFFLIKSNRISRFLLERKERKVFSQISLIIDCEYCTFFFSCSFFDIFHTLCWEKITVNYVSKMLSIWICSCLLITISWDLCLAIYSKILSYLNWI